MSRSLMKNVFIEASPDVVWRALTVPKELSRWLPVDARLEPGVGGTITFNWGASAEASAPITAWEPDRLLEWTEESGSERLTVDVNLEARAGCTAVRVVEAGFGSGPQWDEEIAMRAGGWSYFLQHLKWYLERHIGTPRQLVAWRETVPLDRDRAFNRLVGPEGLSATGTLTHLTAGDSYETTTAQGERLSGMVVARGIETCQIGLTVTELNNAMLFVEAEDEEPGSRPGFWLSTYGLDKKAIAGIRERFGLLYRSALGLESASPITPVTPPVTAKG